VQGYWRHSAAFAGLTPAVTAQDRVFIMSSTASLNNFTLMQKTATLMRVPDIHDYEALLGRRHTEYISTLWRGTAVNSVADLFAKHSVMGGLQRRLLDLAAVRYVIASPNTDTVGWGLDLPRTELGDRSLHVYRNDHALPRARYVPRVEVIPDRSVLLNRLVYGDDDLAAVAFVEQPPASGFTGTAGASNPGTVRFVRDEPERLTLEVEAPARGFLVLADQDYPGWRATVNGTEVPIQVANHMFRLIEVPAGTSLVEFRYRPRSLAVGAVVSLLGCAVAGVLLWRPRGARGARRAVPGG
jgi:hypothetical protein